MCSLTVTIRLLMSVTIDEDVLLEANLSIPAPDMLEDQCFVRSGIFLRQSV